MCNFQVFLDIHDFRIVLGNEKSILLMDSYAPILKRSSQILLFYNMINFNDKRLRNHLKGLS